MLKWMKSWLSSQNERPNDFLIIGLGNPGSAYAKTRHNIGFRAVGHFAKRHGIDLRKATGVSAEIGHRSLGKNALRIVLPLTYMNSSGEAVRASIKMFKVPLKQVMVVVDDIAFPVGELRLKEGGSSGGHNGLKSIEEHLKATDYPRLRLGVGAPQGEPLADYVLGKFTPDEETSLTPLFEKAADVLDCWISKGIQAAMTFANTKGES